MQLVVGTYERFLLGYTLPDGLEGDGAQLARAFTHASHQGPVRCVDAGGAFVVSGGQDDQLHLYDAKRNRDLGFLMNPGEGAVPCLQLFTPPGKASPSHLFSGSADGGIAIWKAGGEWEHLKMMKGHKGAVNALAVHPSGRLALSVAHDKQIRMWDLLRGRCTYTAALDAEGSDLQFGPGGGSYALLTPLSLTLHDAARDGSLLARLESEVVRFSAVGRQRQDERVLLVGQEDGSMSVWDTRAGAAGGGAALAARLDKAHKTRLRAILPVGAEPGDALPRLLATASSDGAVKVWDTRRLGAAAASPGAAINSGGFRELASVETRARVTCMALSAPGRRAPALAAAAAVGGGGGGGDAVQKAERRKAKAAAAGEGGEGAPKGKQARQQQKQQQQQNGGGCKAAAGAAEHQQQQQQPKKKGKKQQQQAAAAAMDGSDSGEEDFPTQQQQRQQQRKRPAAASGGGPRARGGGGGGGDEALVPRVQTIIRKKKRRGEGGGDEGEGDVEADLDSAVRIVNRKAPRGARRP